MRRTATGLSPDGLFRLAGAVGYNEYAKKFDQDTRDQYTRAGDAMPGGRYPIRTQQDLDNAAKDWVRTGRAAAVLEHIRSMAKKHGLKLPDFISSSS